MLGILLAWMVGTFVTKPLDYGFNYTGVEQVSTQTIHHTGFTSWDNRQLIIQRAYELGGLEFVSMIECENGNWDMYRVSKTNDHWICQLHYSYNKEFINSDQFNDWNRQLEYCYEKRKANPKLWYWPSRKIKGQTCKDYVKNRFIINT